MHVDLHARYAQQPEARRASELISACVHCGFCLATCPTYLDAGDERDSPRGRIYLIRTLLEEGEPGPGARTHLDRCLTCRSCETTCPSGVKYGSLLDIGRGLLERELPRPPGERLFRYLLRQTVSRPALFAALVRLARGVRAVLPERLRQQLPAPQAAGALPRRSHPRRMLLLAGCGQPAATPATGAAAARVLDRLGISLVTAPQAGCCGAVHYHLGAHDDGRDNMRRNIDAWWPHVESGVEAIVSCATGCGSTIADYGDLLADDPAYAERARRVATLHRDIAEVVEAEDYRELDVDSGIGAVAVHTPCSQQHALGHIHKVETILANTGFELAGTRDQHLCCGSAGTYSLLQPERSRRLRQRKLAALTADAPTLIVTANVGCQLHLAGASAAPVRHWIELLDKPGP
jgi:glycolate oxidase iron-sulfur subunit